MHGMHAANAYITRTQQPPCTACTGEGGLLQLTFTGDFSLPRFFEVSFLRSLTVRLAPPPGPDERFSRCCTSWCTAAMNLCRTSRSWISSSRSCSPSTRDWERRLNLACISSIIASSSSSLKRDNPARIPLVIVVLAVVMHVVIMTRTLCIVSIDALTVGFCVYSVMQSLSHRVQKQIPMHTDLCFP